MASFPDEVYQHIQSMMHPRPKGEWEPMHHRRLGGSTDIYLLTEGVYDIDPSFPFAPTDHCHLKDELNEDGRLPFMRFGLVLVRLSSVDENNIKINTTNILLDAGIGSWDETTQKCNGHPVPEKPARTLLQIFQGIDPVLNYNSIDFVVYSHCHGDHVGWATSFPNAIHCMHRREYEFATFSGCPWRNDAAMRFGPIEAKGKLRLLGDSGDATTKAATYKRNKEADGATQPITQRLPLDESKAPGISLILIDGHTPGHVCVEIQDGNESAIYLGDCMHFPLQVKHPNVAPLFDCCAWKVRPFLPMGGDNVEKTWSPFLRQRSDAKSWNESTSGKSRRKIMTMIAQNQSLLLSPHFPPPGMGHIRIEDETDQGKDSDFQYVPLTSL